MHCIQQRKPVTSAAYTSTNNDVLRHDDYNHGSPYLTCSQVYPWLIWMENSITKENIPAEGLLVNCYGCQTSFPSLLVTSSQSKAWKPNDRRWTCHRQKWPLDPGGHCVMVCVKECASFFRLCSTGHGPLANPVALRWEGADNPNIIQTCGHCFLDTAF